MSKPIWTEARIARLLDEGRGDGVGADYKPFIEISDLSSQGVSRRILGRKTGRVHHLLSNVEYQFFLMLEWSNDVIDIREQYPLPRKLTQAIASERKLSHPYYPGTQVPTVITIDTVATRLIDGQEVQQAFDIKRTEEAENFRSVEKLEITRAACELLGISHHLVFHSLLPHTKIKNIEWILSARSSDDEETAKSREKEHSARLLNYLSRQPQEKTLRQCCDAYDVQLGLAPGSALGFARSLMQERALAPNLANPDLVNAPLNEFQFHAQLGRLRAVGE